MKIRLLYLSIIIQLAISCKNNDTQNQFRKSEGFATKSIEPYWISVDSIKYDPSIKGYKLKPLDSSLRARWTDNIFPLNKIKPLYQAYYYNLDHSLFNGIILFANADDYSGVFIISLKKGRLIDYSEISGGFCSGPYQDEKTKETVWRPDKKAFILNDSSLVISEIDSRSKSYDKEFPKTIDSVTYILRFTPSGKFKKAFKDSIRYTITKGE